VTGLIRPFARDHRPERMEATEAGRQVDRPRQGHGPRAAGNEGTRMTGIKQAMARASRHGKIMRLQRRVSSMRAIVDAVAADGYERLATDLTS